jgi:MFS family permease
MLADRTGRRRRIAVAALLLDALLMGLLAVADSFALFLGLRVLEGMAHIAALSTVLAAAADAAGERRGRVLGVLGMGLTFGVAVGAALGGRIGRSNATATLEAAAACLVLAAVLASVAMPRDVRPAARLSYRAIVRAVGGNPGMAVPLALAFVDRFTVGFFTTGFPLYLAGVHGLPRDHIGKLLAAFLCPFALLSVPFGRLAERRRPVALVALGSLLYGLGAMAVAAVDPGWLWLLMPCLGVASAVMFVPNLLMTIAAAPAVGRATAVAAFNAAGSLGFALGPLACGELIHAPAVVADGYVLAFVVAGLTEVLCAVLLVPRLRRRAPPPAP